MVTKFMTRDEAGNPVAHSKSRMFIGHSIPHSELIEWTGIRYGEAPVGPLRFSRPLPYRPEEAVEYCQAVGPAAPQRKSFAMGNLISEDCLSMNLIRPSTVYSKALPVMFWIHGGNNDNGQSGMYSGRAVVEKSIVEHMPVIWIAINYRVNGFGFLASEDLLTQGNVNLGLYDQELALEWVQEHIAAFGGDNNRVIILGESSGAANAWAQIARAKPRSNPLFHGAILQSGLPGALYPHSDRAQLFEPAFCGLLVRAGYDGSTDPLSWLRNMPFDELSTIFNPDVGQLSWQLSHRYATGTVRDGYWYKGSVWDSLQTPDLSPVPMIIGCNLDDGTRAFGDILADISEVDLLESIRNATNDESNEWAQKLWSHYKKQDFSKRAAQDEKDAQSPASNDFYAAAAMFGFLYFRSAVYHTAQRMSEHRKTPIWVYHFEQRPPLASIDLPYAYPGTGKAEARRLGVFHGSELAYMLGEIQELEDATEGDIELSSYMLRSWISFANHLDPNTPGHNERTYWEEFSKQNRVMVLQNQNGQGLRMSADVFQEDAVALLAENLSEDPDIYTPTG